MISSDTTVARPAQAAAALEGHGGHRSLLRMSAGGELVAVPIESVREILEVGRLTPLPRTPDFVRGVMNLRGSVVPVVDLSARIEHGSTTIGRRSCIVVVEVGSHDDDEDGAASNVRLVVGLLVDAVFEVFDAPPEQVEPVPMLGTRIDPHYLAAMARARAEVVAVLDLPHLLSVRDLANAIASHQPQ